MIQQNHFSIKWRDLVIFEYMILPDMILKEGCETCDELKIYFISYLEMEPYQVCAKYVSFLLNNNIMNAVVSTGTDVTLV